jgi:TonB family protein
VQENWSYPEAYQRAGLSMIVSLRIARTGKLISVWVEERSGNPRFDSSLVNAVKKAAPFEPLPQGFDGAWLETGLRFCPECSY